jgi:putative ABC transport system permease protein
LFGLVVRDAMTLTAVGMGLGVGGALLLTRVLRSLLFGVTPTDPTTFAAVGFVLLVVALAAATVPAWRAVRVDPGMVLRGE